MSITNQKEGRVSESAARATMQWFQSEAEFEAFVDQIIEKADAQEPQPIIEQPSLFEHLEESKHENAPTKLSLRGIVSQAFRSMFDGMPEDHVIIQPELNAEFLSRCRLLGADTTDYALNKTLLNVRKAGWHSGILRSRPTPLDHRTLDRISYGAEIAARLVQLYSSSIYPYQSEPTIDQLLCDPDLRSIFDAYADELVPGFSLYEYRLAALHFRKSGGASTDRLANTDIPDWELKAPLASLDPSDVPHKSGMYLISTGNKPLFWSSSMDLHERVHQHIMFADGRTFLPAAIGETHRKLTIQILTQPASWNKRRTEAVVTKKKNCVRTPYNLLSAV